MRIALSNASPDPIYRQIVAQLRAQILSGELAEGAPLPSIRRLAKELRISVITTKRAYEELEREGFVDSVGGRGTFVAAQSEELRLETRRRLVEETLAEAIQRARLLGLPRGELHEMVDLLWPDGRGGADEEDAA